MFESRGCCQCCAHLSSTNVFANNVTRTEGRIYYKCKKTKVRMKCLYVCTDTHVHGQRVRHMHTHGSVPILMLRANYGQEDGS